MAYRGLEHLFPKASISTNKLEPGYWDSLSNYDSGQALIIVTGKFSPDEIEMKNLFHLLKMEMMCLSVQERFLIPLVI